MNQNKTSDNHVITMDEINLNSSVLHDHGDMPEYLANGCAADSRCQDQSCNSGSQCQNEIERSSSEDIAPVPPTPAIPPEDEMSITVATQYGRIDRVRRLFATEGVDVNQPDAEGCYLMHWAAINNRVDLIK